jgi:hypothetical protein
MSPTIATLSPRQTFEDNMRPAQLLLKVYRLLDSNDTIMTEGKLVSAMRGVLQTTSDEYLLLICNELFLGLVRERAGMAPVVLRQATLCHLLRQAVVASCTAMETYLPVLLRSNMPVMIQARGRDFISPGDQDLQPYVGDMTFTLDDVLRLLADPNAPEFIANKIISLTDFNYLGGRKGITVVGKLLGLAKPWEEIAAHLTRDRRELANVIEETVRRRNDIVHRADRSQDNPAGDPQSITFAWAQQAVDTINVVCLALDELVETKIELVRAMIEA